MNRMDEAFDRAMRRVAELQEQLAEATQRGELYRLAWGSARFRAYQRRNRIDFLERSWSGVLDQTRAERDEARAEVVRLGKALEQAEHDNCGCLGYPLGVGEDEVTAAHTRLRAALDEERIEPEPCAFADIPQEHGAGGPCVLCGFERTEGEAG